MLPPFILFTPTSFLLPPWTPISDRLRGGTSYSHLTPLPTPNAGVQFHGHLDTSTLGGAGFASQFSPPDAESLDGKGSWDLSGYDGLEVGVGSGDGRVYTFVVKDGDEGMKEEGMKEEGMKEEGMKEEGMKEEGMKEEGNGQEQGQRDGKEKAGISWEVEFKVEDGGEGGKVWMPWTDFKATYRGKEVDAGELKTGTIRKVGIMMRSYFGKQDGDFSMELRSISARQKTDEDDGRRGEEKRQVGQTPVL